MWWYSVMDGDTQPSRSFYRRPLFLAVVVLVLAASAIWASASLAGGSAPQTPAKAKVTKIDRGYAGNGGSHGECPFKHNRVDTSDDV
jgi:hypothetical protein